MNCKSVITNFFTVVVLIVKIITAISKPKGHIYVYYQIW